MLFEYCMIEYAVLNILNFFSTNMVYQADAIYLNISVEYNADIFVL